MIDSGEAVDSDTILAFLDEVEVDRLDLMILTHPDKDHIGSAATLLETIDVAVVIQPYYAGEKKTLDALKEVILETGTRQIIPNKVWRQSIHDLTLSVYPPEELEYGNDNNYSLAIYVEHGDVRMLFPGDAKNKRLRELLALDWPQMDLYKLPHHGRYSERSEELFSLLRPTYTVVTSDHAATELTELGDSMGTQWFFTVGQTVRFQSDGKTLSPS